MEKPTPNVSVDNPAKSRDVLGQEDKGMLNAFSKRKGSVSASFLFPNLTASTHLLDVGCGPGSITHDLAQVCTEGRVVGIDESPEAIATARRAQEDNISSDPTIVSAEFMEGSAYDLPFPSACFDVVFAHQLMQYLTKPREALAEFERVLKPGGVLALRSGCGPDTILEPKSNHGLSLLLELIWKALAVTGSDPLIPRAFPRLLREFGFTNVTLSSDMGNLSNAVSRDGFASVWESKIRDGDVTLETWRQNGLLSEGDEQSILEGLSQFRNNTDGFLLFPIFAVLGFKPVDE